MADDHSHGNRQKDLLEEALQDPELYGLRRTKRARTQVTRYEEEFIDEPEPPKRGKRKRVIGSDSEAENGSDETESEEESDSDIGYKRKSRNKLSRKKAKVKNRYDSDEDIDYSAVRFSGRSKSTVNYNEDTFLDDELSDVEVETRRKKKYQVVEPEVDEITIEAVMDHQIVDKKADESDEESSEEIPVTEFLIKWKGRSHLHNTWEPLETLRDIKGFKKVQNYIKALTEEDLVRSNVDNADEVEERDIELEMKRAMFEDYKSVERVIAQRNGYYSDENQSGTEYLCKWKRLDYKDCTWEAASLISDRFQPEIDAFLEREYNKLVPHRSKNYAKGRPVFQKLKAQPEYVTNGELREYQLIGVNWMLYLWCRNENGILADEMGLGKTVQTITTLNVLHHDYELHGPFLVVVPLSVIHSWQNEFAKWAPSLNAIVYIGNRESREIIRQYEFYQNEGGKSKKTQI